MGHADKIRERYPNLVLENCSSGGGRLDGGAMRHSDITAMTDMAAPAALGIPFGPRTISPRSMRQLVCLLAGALAPSR